MTDSRSQPTPEPVRQHTPTPWYSKLYDVNLIIYGPDKIQVMATSWHSSIRESYPLKAESLANAAFVLEAVNSYASLKARVEELEKVVGWVDSWVSNPVGSYSVCALDGLFRTTREKIAALPQSSTPARGSGES